MNNRRMYVGKLLDRDNELDAITRRQTIQIVKDESLPLPPLPRDWRQTIAAIGIGFVLAGLFVSLVIAVVTAR